MYYFAKACVASSPISPLASTSIQRRDPTPRDVQIEILFCGICHSDLHQVRNVWSSIMPTVYPTVRRIRLNTVNSAPPGKESLDAGADDVEFVEIGGPALDDQRRDILKSFPHTDFVPKPIGGHPMTKFKSCHWFRYNKRGHCAAVRIRS